MPPDWPSGKVSQIRHHSQSNLLLKVFCNRFRPMHLSFLAKRKPMEKLHVLLSLTTEVNDYQQEQARDAEENAHRLGIDLRIIYADNDAIVQSQQLLEAIQNKSNRPNAIVFEPVGTGLNMVAKAAAEANIGWVVLNRDVDYFGELRRINKSPMFSVSSDHVEVGRIQGRQLARLLPSGGNVLYVQGPVSHLAAAKRTQGAMETKGSSINLRVLK